MPRRDGTGPMSAGPMTGRRMGYCARDVNVYGERKFRFFNQNQPIDNESIVALREQINALQQQVIQLQETINKNEKE